MELQSAMREIAAESPRSRMPGDSPAILLSHPTGNQNVRNALRSLAEHEMLAEFWTSIAWDEESPWNKLLPSKLRAQFARRAFADAPGTMVKCVPFREMVRLAIGSSRLGSAFRSAERPFSVIGVYRHFDATVARRVRDLKLDAVYAYEGGAVQTFREAQRRGVTTLYELTAAHWDWKQRMMSEEADANPAFAGLLPQLKDSALHLQLKGEELDRADIIFVPSHHVRRTLQGVVRDEKIRVIPYGAPPVRPRKKAPSDPGQPLKVLFVGALAQHKGIGYLLDAVDQLGSQVHLTLAGRRYTAHPRVDEACRRWTWFESLPHYQVLDLMMRSDVLVLPSFSEGFALVVTEALCSGLPVIITPNVGAVDMVRDGQDGFVVPLRSSEAIADRLSALHTDRELLSRMSQNAQATAARQPWEVYRATWAEAVRTESCL